jgi:C-terminal processing protease CtpA/Prc
LLANSFAVAQFGSISTSMTRPILSLIIALSTLSLTQGTSAMDDKGWFGMSVSVDAEGISLNPTIRSIKVVRVVPTSPAGSAGLIPGDSIVEVQGITVAGAKADVLKAAMQKGVGEALRLKVRRDTTAPRELTLIAISKPPGI